MIRADLNEPLVPAFGVALNGTLLGKDVAGWIARVLVEDDLDVPGMFTFELISKEDLNGTAPWTDDSRFSLGMNVSVSFGYGDQLEAVISGEITALEPAFHVGGPPTLLVRGYDVRHRLNAARRTRAFVDATDSQIAEQICKSANVKIDATDSKVQHKSVLQAGQTDLDFLLDRARRIQFELAVEGDKLLFRPAGNTAKPADGMAFTFRDDLLEFNPRLSLVPVTQTRLLFWDSKEKAPATATATTVGAVGAMEGRQSESQAAGAVFTIADQTTETDVDVVVASQPEADQVAQAKFNTAALDYVRGDGACRGCTGLRAGAVMSLDGLGKRFSGNYYITSVVHSYTRRDGYLTQFRVQRNES